MRASERWWALMVVLVCSCLPPMGPQRQPRIAPEQLQEAEVAVRHPRSRRTERRAYICASEGHSLGRQFGQHREDAAYYEFDWQGPGAAVLWLRAAVHLEEQQRPRTSLRVFIDGHRGPNTSPAETGHWERFEWTSVALGELQPGPRQIGLVCEAVGVGCNLDQIALLVAGQRPAQAASPAVHSEGDLEIRSPAGQEVWDASWVFGLLRTQRDWLAAEWGYDVEGVISLVPMPARQWPDSQVAAFQAGRMVFLRSDQLHLAWCNYAHELCHVFQEERQPTPLFFTEGVAFCVAVQAALDLYGQEEFAAQEVHGLTTLVRRGDEHYSPGSGQPNPLFLWGTEDFGTHGDRWAYRWSCGVVWELFRDRGMPWLRKIYLQRAAPGARVVPCVESSWTEAQQLVEDLSEATGEDLTGYFRHLGLIEHHEPTSS